MDNTPYITETDFIRLRNAMGKMNMSAAVAYVADTLRDTLNGAKRVPSEKITADIVTMNSEVELRDLGTDTTVAMTVTYPEDVDLKNRRVSVLTPAGAAVFAKRIGDRVQWLTPTGVKVFVLEKIRYQPEAAGDFHL